jgi:hypothetical protein
MSYSLREHTVDEVGCDALLTRYPKRNIPNITNTAATSGAKKMAKTMSDGFLPIFLNLNCAARH